MPGEICKCPVCNKNVTKTMKSVSCAYCEKYHHIKCAKMSDEQHTMLIKNRIFYFICQTCSRLPKYCDVQEQLRVGLASMTAHVEKEMEVKFAEFKRHLAELLETGLRTVREDFEKFTNNHSEDNSDCVKDLKSDLKNCYRMVKHVDDATNQKMHTLEIQNSIFQRRLNRSDIIIKGLPKSIKNLRKPIVKVASLCGVRLYYSDIQHCTYFAGGKSVLVKFNSVQIRDTIMINYRKNISIKVNDVIGGAGNTDVFLNDHLTSAAKELIAVCKNLRTSNIIRKYTYKNYDIPKVKVVMSDGSIEVFNYQQCVALLEERGSFSTPSRSSGLFI